ncbi:MAG TPA: glutamate racemase [Vicinamibacteria bacterium]|nr:glutamate racemase [Vicinamibacteria bacterium]
MRARPIGIFDSGVGGLSVAREIRRTLPAEDIVYVADAAHCPYGDRPAAEVRERALAIGRHLEAAEAKLVVVACNTATGAALEDLRAALRVPAVGLEPAVKTAAARTRNGRIGVMATAGTIASARFQRLVQQHANGLGVVAQPCPGLVDLIEEGELSGPRLQALLERLTAPLRAAAVDAVVLGCTHYPFVSEAIAGVLGAGVELIDSAPAIARRTQSLLEEAGLRNAGPAGAFRMATTGDPAATARMAARLLGAPVDVTRIDV